jgi:hypothetical protein
MRVPLYCAVSTTSTPPDMPLIVRLRMEKVLWSREGSDQQLGDQLATESHDLLGEPRVFLGVHDVNSGAEDGDGVFPWQR